MTNSSAQRLTTQFLTRQTLHRAADNAYNRCKFRFYKLINSNFCIKTSVWQALDSHILCVSSTSLLLARPNYRIRKIGTVFYWQSGSANRIFVAAFCVCAANNGLLHTKLQKNGGMDEYRHKSHHGFSSDARRNDRFLGVYSQVREARRRKSIWHMQG